MTERKFTVITVYRAHFNVRCVNVDIVLLRQDLANVAIPVIIMNGGDLQLGFMVIIEEREEFEIPNQLRLQKLGDGTLILKRFCCKLQR